MPPAHTPATWKRLASSIVATTEEQSLSKITRGLVDHRTSLSRGVGVGFTAVAGDGDGATGRPVAEGASLGLPDGAAPTFDGSAAAGEEGA